MAINPPKTMKFVNCIVPIGQSLSTAVDLEGYKLVGIIMPTAIEATTARMTFQASNAIDGTYVSVVKNATAIALTFAVSTYEVLDGVSLFTGVRWLKIRMETGAGAAVAQATAARTFVFILEALK